MATEPQHVEATQDGEMPPEPAEYSWFTGKNLGLLALAILIFICIPLVGWLVGVRIIIRMKRQSEAADRAWQDWWEEVYGDDDRDEGDQAQPEGT